MQRSLAVKFVCNDVKKYFINRMYELNEEGKSQEACAIHEELREWLDSQANDSVITLRRKLKN